MYVLLITEEEEEKKMRTQNYEMFLCRHIHIVQTSVKERIDR